MTDDSKLISQALTLAPAAGSGIGKAFADALTADEEFLPLLVAAAKDGLKASRSFWVKDGSGSGYLETEPDTRSRIQTLALVLAHMEGEPVKRIIHQHIGEGGKLDVGGALADSPELAAAVERELQKSKWRHSGRQAHKKPAKVVEGDAKDVPAGPAKEF